MNVLWLSMFWAMQIGASLLFKYGATAPERYWIGFLGGNVFGASSIFLLMQLYKTMQVNVAMSLGAGGAFFLGQIALALVFRQNLNWIQYAGIAVITVGMVVVTLYQTA